MRKTYSFAWLLTIVLTTASASDAADPTNPMPVLVGVVTKVSDGDSIEVDLDSGHGRVRFQAIDTPEYDQPYGSQSSAALKALLPVGTEVELEVVTQDQFHRMVAIVWMTRNGERINVNETLLREGHAWAYRRYMKDPKYCDIEDLARAKKAGLWAQPVKDWVYPPEWRAFRNGEIRSLPTPYEETRATCLDVLSHAGAAT